MSRISFQSSSKATSLKNALRRLDDLMDWERKRRVRGSVNQMRVTSKPSMDLLSRIDFPNKHFKAVHVTGSKGKGSVATLITAALQRAPFTSGPIGTYGSPHVEIINERVRIDGSPVSDDTLADSIETVLDARDKAPLLEDATWFDVLSVAGMHAFKERGVEWAVIEVGMGGRLDSTNVLSAPVSVITNIYMEHAEIIGPTLEDIAFEKAGIIAPGADVVLGMSLSNDLSPIFMREAAKHNPPATIIPVPRLEKSLFAQNLHIARTALRCIADREGSDMLEEELLPDSLARSTLGSLPARQERFSIGQTSVLLDGAHVADSVAHVLKENRGARPPIVVLGVGREKDVAAICRVVLMENPVHIFATVAGHEDPYLPCRDLATSLGEAGGTHVTAVPDACEALHEAIDLSAKTGSGVVVIGSLHLAGKIRPELRRLEGGEIT